MELYTRSDLIEALEKRINKEGYSCSFKSLDEFRILFPSAPSPLFLENLSALVKQTGRLPVAAWRERRQVKHRNYQQKVKLSYAHIRNRRKKGQTYKEIAIAAGCSAERVRQICHM